MPLLWFRQVQRFLNGRSAREVHQNPSTGPCGIRHFDFDKCTVGEDTDVKQVNFAELFHLIAGTYGKDQVMNFNGYVEEYNMKRKDKKRTIAPTSIFEIDIFIAILLIGRLEGHTNLWGGGRDSGHSV